MINSTKEWHWMDDKQFKLDQALRGWGFDIEALRESEGVSPLSTKSPRANSTHKQAYEEYLRRETTPGVAPYGIKLHEPRKKILDFNEFVKRNYKL